MKIKKLAILYIFTGLITVNMSAQKNGYEIGLCGSAGLSALQFTTADGSKPSYNAGYVFGWDIAVLFTGRWSFRTGVNMASYRSTFSSVLQKTRNLIPTPDNLPDDSRFYMIAEYNRYEERHEAFYLRFPLMIQYRIPAGAKQHFYAAAGVHAGIQTNSACRIHSGDVVTKGYSDYTMQYYEEMPGHGFDTYRNIRSAGKLDFGFVLSGAIETGMMWSINNGMALYTGIFLDYGLNDVRRGSLTKESFVFDEKEGAYMFNSILYSKNEEKPMTGKVQPLAVGLRLRWSMLFSK